MAAAAGVDGYGTLYPSIAMCRNPLHIQGFFPQRKKANRSA
jgi:hypothetical protein